jgi:hypothetical protein
MVSRLGKFSDLLDANTYKAFAKIDTANGARAGLFVPERAALFVGATSRQPVSGNSLLSD